MADADTAGRPGRLRNMVDPSLPDLSGTVTVVTGASGGIGAGVARRFAAAGAALVLGYRSAAGPDTMTPAWPLSRSLTASSVTS